MIAGSRGFATRGIREKQSGVPADARNLRSSRSTPNTAGTDAGLPGGNRDAKNAQARRRHSQNQVLDLYWRYSSPKWASRTLASARARKIWSGIMTRKASR